MATIKLAGRVPNLKSALSQGIVFYGLGFCVLVGIVIFMGFKYRAEKERERKDSNIQKQVASDAATSNRQNQEGDAAAEFKPVVTPPQEQAPQPTPPAVVPPQAPVTPLVNPEEQERLEEAKQRWKREQEAMQGPTGITSGQGASTPLPMSQTGVPGALEPANTQKSAADSKEQFAKDTDVPNPADDVLKATRLPPLTPFLIMQGSRIPATLDVKAISENPGKLTAQVSRDVYDSRTGKYVLIPATSKLIGEYNAQVGYAQNRLQVVWTRIIFPDTSSMDLGRMNGYDAEGASGMHDQVDSHWKRIIGGALLTSMLTAGFQLSQNHSNNSSVLSYPSSGQVVAGAVGIQGQELATQLTSRNLSIPPTIKLRVGDEFVVLAAKDLVFSEPYKPMEAVR